MIALEYQQQLQKKIRKYFPSEKVFIFGSSVRSQQFHDIDVAILDLQEEKSFFKLQEDLEKSTFPYIVDLVNFKKTSKEFSEFVLSHEKKIWI